MSADDPEVEIGSVDLAYLSALHRRIGYLEGLLRGVSWQVQDDLADRIQSALARLQDEDNTDA